MESYDIGQWLKAVLSETNSWTAAGEAILELVQGKRSSCCLYHLTGGDHALSCGGDVENNTGQAGANNL